MIQQEMDDLVFFFQHIFVHSDETEDKQKLLMSDANNVEKRQTDDGNNEPPVYWKIIEDPELPPGYKKVYFYATENWKPCERKDARNCYIVIYDENDVCVDSYHARVRRNLNTENK